MKVPDGRITPWREMSLAERRRDRLRHFLTLLSRWNGGTATLHELTISHRTLFLRVEQPDRVGFLEIACIGPLRLQGPVAWNDCELTTTLDDDGRFCVRDLRANVDIVAENVELRERQSTTSDSVRSRFQQALATLLGHGIGNNENDVLTEGFLGCLRPLTGLREDNFLQLIEAVIALSPVLAEESQLDRRLVRALWELTTRARQIALDPDSMLQRNRLLTDDETAKLRLWVQCLEMAISRLLRGEDPSAGLVYYRETMEKTG